MENHFTSFEDMPLFLSAPQIAQILGISRAGAYQLMHAKGFPTIRLGKRMVVSKEQMLNWLDAQTAESNPII